MDNKGAIKAARAEATRCRRAVTPGTRLFWMCRLADAAKRYEAAAAILRMQLAVLESDAQADGAA